MMRRFGRWIPAIVWFAVAGILFAQSSDDSLLDAVTGDVDGLFEDAEEAPPADGSDETEVAEKTDEEEATDGDGEEDVDLLNEVVRKEKVSLGGLFRFFGGYSAGWNYTPWLSSPGGGPEGYNQGALADIYSAFSLDFRISPVFRALMTFRFRFPDFDSEIAEFFVDYSIADAVYFRIGRQYLNWGLSRFHQFVNFPNRVTDDYGILDPDLDNPIQDADSYTIKINVPIGTGGVEALGITRTGFWSDPDYPAIDDIGWGGGYNLARPSMDFTVGTYYHPQMKWWSFYSLGFTVFRRLDFYQESSLGFDPNEPNLNWGSLEFGANAGFILDLFQGNLILTGEYYWNGETADLSVKYTEFPLVTGHNIAGGLTASFFDNKLRVFAQTKYSITENSGIFIPAINWYPLPNLTLTAAFPIVYGDPNGTYAQYNPDNEDRIVSFVIAVILSGAF